MVTGNAEAVGSVGLWALSTPEGALSHLCRGSPPSTALDGCPSTPGARLVGKFGWLKGPGSNSSPGAP